MTTVAKVELTKRAMVARSESLSHLRRPPILSRNNVTDIFTRQMIRLPKIPATKFNFAKRTTCAISKWYMCLPKPVCVKDTPIPNAAIVRHCGILSRLTKVSGVFRS